jgi:hypothetical protein
LLGFLRLAERERAKEFNGLFRGFKSPRNQPVVMC